MSKLTRTVLKEIVKECIVEIFEESFFNPNGGMINESKSSRANHSRQNTTRLKRPVIKEQHYSKKASYLDNVSYGNKNTQQEKNKNFERKVNTLTSRVTNDPVMSEIFKDTAATTLQSQNSADTKRGVGNAAVMVNGDAAAKAVSQSDPTELFAESAGKWATLAFADPIKK